MTKATVRFSDYSVPDLRIYVSNGGNQSKMRRALRTACYKRRSAVKTDLASFIPHVIYQLRKLGLVRLESAKIRTDLTYSIGSGEDGAIMLRISGKERNEPVSFVGPFFRWLGNSELRITSNKMPLRGSVKQRRDARLAAVNAEYNKQHKTTRRFYTPLQQRMRKQRDAIIKEHKARSDGAKRRHERKRVTPKYSLDDLPK